jgi:hypothetical protein
MPFTVKLKFSFKTSFQIVKEKYKEDKENF